MRSSYEDLNSSWSNVGCRLPFGGCEREGLSG